MRTKHKTIAALLLSAVGLALPASAQAASPAWQIGALANSSAEPGTVLDYRVEIRNAGDTALNGSTQPIAFSGTLPAGLTIAAVQMVSATEFSLDCSGIVAGAQTFTCESSQTLPTQQEDGLQYYKTMQVQVQVEPGASGLLSAEFEIAGGDPSNPSASTVAPATITTDPLGFGIAAFDVGSSADAAGTPFTQAAGHPYAQSTSIDFNTYKDAAPLKDDLTPVEASKDIEVELPPGFLGNPQAVERCTLSQLANSSGQLPEPFCPPSSQVGMTIVRSNTLAFHQLLGPIPVFNMVRPSDATAQLGFNVSGVVVTLNVNVRSGSDYGITAQLPDISQALALAGSTFTLWGDPADPAHDLERACPGKRAPWDTGPTCLPTIAPSAFLREPTSCTAPGQGLPYTLRIDSWVHPGAFDERTIHSHLPKGYPWPEEEWGAPQGPSGCANVPFEPSLSAQPTTNVADSPSGLDVHLSVPQSCWAPGQQDSICQSDLRDAEVKLPEGMSLNPSAAAGLEACSESQVGYKPATSAPLEFSPAPANCPNGAKIGSVTITTPLLEEELSGAVYLAKQGENPFDSLLAMYLVAEGSGVVVKQAGEIVSDPNTGRLTTLFKDAPQQPFSDLHVELFGGPRAALRTPAACGPYTTQASLTPWSGNAPVSLGSSFAIEKCKGSGFAPKLAAGAQNPLAGITSPFSLRISREDDEAELGAITATLPPGLSGYLKGIPYCPDSALAAVSGNEGTGRAQEAHPSCPPASQLGTVTVGAGAGPTPFFTSAARAYLSGPYKGAPLSLAVIAPAVAGPFDLGSVVVRNAIHIDPESGQLTVTSDPLPHILHGVPLDLRDIRVEVSRDHFALNPTSCEPFQVGSAITSTTGASADPSVHFQVAGCERLAFKPTLGLRLSGKPNRGAHPALRAALAFAKAGGANLASAQVALPHSEFLDQAHIRTICTRVQFAAGAGGGSECPKGSVYGSATATSPIVDYPVSGPVYLRSSNHKLPDLLLALKGPASQPVEIDAVGRIDSIRGGIRTTFESTPDLPLTQVVLNMKGGKKGLIQNSRNICAHEYRATAELGGQNGKAEALRPLLRDDKCARHHAHKHRGGRR